MPITVTDPVAEAKLAAVAQSQPVASTKTELLTALARWFASLPPAEQQRILDQMAAVASK
jgi:hypothetical protein